MSSSDHPDAPDPKPEWNPPQPPPAEKTIHSGTAARFAGKAVSYLAALAAVSAAPAGAAVPAAEPDRGYLEALLHGSWMPSPDLSARRRPHGWETDPDQSGGEFDAATFIDATNPPPRPRPPYSDYPDTGFGDRSN